MKYQQRFVCTLLVTLVSLVFAPRVPSAQENTTSAVPAHLVVTAEARHGNEVPVINREDVMVYQGHDRDPVTSWVPLEGDHAALQLYLLIDDAASTTLGTQFDDLRRFISSQPETTAIGLAYMRNGTVDIAHDLTTNHAEVAKALRLPLENIGAFGSLYLSMVDLIKRWPQSPVRREIVVVSDGIDRFGGSGPANPYVDTAIETAQRAGIILYAIYTNGFGHYGRSFWRIDWGQNYLSQLADETGGEAYFVGFGPPVSFAPFLDDINKKLMHQYGLDFLVKPKGKSGLQPVKVKTELSNVELTAADRVYVTVPAGSGN
jgi:hypothetical protein